MTQNAKLQISKGKITKENLLFLQESSIPKSRNPYLKKGDIIVVRSGAYTGDLAMITEEFDGSIAGYDLIVSPSDNLDSYFCMTFLLGPITQSYFLSQSIRSAQPHLNLKQLSNTIIPIPTMKVQKQMREILIDLDQSIDSLFENIEQIICLKKHFLNNLLSGQIRLGGPSND